MGKTRKQEIRRKFRESVFARDNHRCVVCGFQSSPERVDHELDAHHIIPREEMPNGGYVKENGVSLCDPSRSGKPLAHGCHYKAELVLQALSAEGNWLKDRHEHEPFHEYTPQSLFDAVGSSYDQAFEASGYLK